jgi:hypothetical protein
MDWVQANRQYNFILENDEDNRLVCGSQNRLFFIETFDLSTNPPTLVNDVPPLKCLTPLSSLSETETTGVMHSDQEFPYVKYKIVSPNWEQMVKIRGNHNSPQRVFLHVYQTYGKNSEEMKTVYRTLYPNYDFDTLVDSVERFIDTCFNLHLNRVNGRREMIDKSYYSVIKEANMGWKEHKRVVTRQVISEVVWKRNPVWLTAVLGC